MQEEEDSLVPVLGQIPLQPLMLLAGLGQIGVHDGAVEPYEMAVGVIEAEPGGAHLLVVPGQQLRGDR